MRHDRRFLLADCLKTLAFGFEARLKSDSSLDGPAYRIFDDDERVRDKYIFGYDIGSEGSFIVALKRRDSLHIPVKIQQVEIAVGQGPCLAVPFEQSSHSYLPTTITVPLAGSLLESLGPDALCHWFGDVSAKYVQITFIIGIAPEEDLTNGLTFRDEIFARVQYPRKRPLRWLLQECSKKWKGLPPEVRIVIKWFPHHVKKGLQTVGMLAVLPFSIWHCCIHSD